MRPLVFASNNHHKLTELRALLAPSGRVVLGLPEALGTVPELPEPGPTLLANAQAKAGWVAARTPELVLADDTGLEVDALAGAPGVHTARYAGPEASSWMRIEKVLTALAHVPPGRRTARFRCVLVLQQGVQVLEIREGVTEGTIALAPRGRAGFGFDPVFVPAGSERTYAELAPDELAVVGHRGRALAALAEHLGALG